MKTRLSKQQISSYRDNGFLAINNWLTADELAVWRSAFDEAVAERTTRLPGREGPPAKAGEYYDNIFVQRVNLWRTNDNIRRLLIEPRIGKLAATLEGIDAVRVWHDQALVKEPWANPTPWHLDGAYWSFHSRHAISIWIALDDVTIQNGCLYFLPGAHKEADFANISFGPNMKGMFEQFPRWGTIEPVPIVMQAGSCSFHNGLTPHAAGPNMTTGLRRALACIFMPDGATFNGQKNILTDEQVAALKVGDVLDDDDLNPLTFSAVNAPRPVG